MRIKLTSEPLIALQTGIQFMWIALAILALFLVASIAVRYERVLLPRPTAAVREVDIGLVNLDGLVPHGMRTCGAVDKRDGEAWLDCTIRNADGTYKVVFHIAANGAVIGRVFTTDVYTMPGQPTPTPAPLASTPQPIRIRPWQTETQ